ncbi:MAG: hypothetical protein ABEJ42_09310 [Halobacteriaceae archaeon]
MVSTTVTGGVLASAGATTRALAALAPLQSGLLGDPLGKLLVAVVVLLVVVFVGRFVLAVAWKLLLVAAVLIGAAWLVSVLLP